MRTRTSVVLSSQKKDEETLIVEVDNSLADGGYLSLDLSVRTHPIENYPSYTSDEQVVTFLVYPANDLNAIANQFEEVARALRLAAEIPV